MEDRPGILPRGELERMAVEALRTQELRYAAAHFQGPLTVHRLNASAAEGSPVVEVVHFLKTGRIGIGWANAAWWLDAPSIESGLEQWMRGEGRCNTRPRGDEGAEAVPAG
jgi:hypothetical protein